MTLRGRAPGPGSFTWRYSGDARIMAGAGYALVLQVAHPTVAAGVREHSNYAEDPWGRLLRTLDFVFLVTYGGQEAAEETGRQLREMHKHIKGVKPDGTRYHALEPEAYAWVHATLFEATIEGHRRFGQRLSRSVVEGLYAEWRDVGGLLGLREDDLPATWDGFRIYFDEFVRDKLENNDVIHGVLETLTKPKAPDLPVLNRDPAWRALRLPAARMGSLATVGMLPPLLRERCGLTWTRSQDLELRALGALSRSLKPLMPERLLNIGPPYLRWRRDAIQRGEFAAGGRHLPALA